MTEARFVKDVMSRQPLTVARNDPLRVPDELMREKRIRHVPVLDEDGELCGLVTRSDLFRGALLRALGFGQRAEDTLLETVVVKEVMTESLRTTTPATPIESAAAQMAEHKIGCLPVLQDSKLVGIVTDADFVALVTGTS